MSRQQRLAFAAIAAVIAVIAIVVLAGGGDEEPATTPAAATATPTPATSPTPQAAEPAETETPEETPEPTPTPEDTGPVLTAGSDEVVEAKEGDTIRFTVESEAADHVHVHGYDLMKDVKAGGSVDFEFKATITGIFEIELEDAGTPVGQLKVEP